jgi:hypothetical protein
MALHILADYHNVIGLWLVLSYMQTPLTHYFLESSGRATYMHGNSPLVSYGILCHCAMFFDDTSCEQVNKYLAWMMDKFIHWSKPYLLL